MSIAEKCYHYVAEQEEVRFLFDFGFFVNYVLAYHRVVLLHFKFVRHSAFVFTGRVVMASTGARH